MRIKIYAKEKKVLLAVWSLNLIVSDPYQNMTIAKKKKKNVTNHLCLSWFIMNLVAQAKDLFKFPDNDMKSKELLPTVQFA